MQLLLPTKDELKQLERFKGERAGLGPAELFFLSVIKVARFPQKLSVFKFRLQYDEHVTTLASNLEVLATSCNEIINSNTLATLLKRLLAIGNLMNESVGKPKAVGITLDR